MKRLRVVRPRHLSLIAPRDDTVLPLAAWVVFTCVLREKVWRRNR